MYNSNDIAERIKKYAKSQNITLKDLLVNCGLSKNALSSMLSGGSIPKADNLAKIADQLNCSVDYLLGRTDIPEINSGNIENIDLTDLPAETIYKLVAFAGKDNKTNQLPIKKNTTL